MNTSRWAWADIAKGIAILLVVVNHAGEGILNAGIGVEVPLWKHFHDLCYTFMVPVFFLFSGWFSQVSSKQFEARARALFSNLIYPYLLWSVLQAALMIVTASGNEVPTWSDLPNILLNGWMQFWFLHCLILIKSIDLILRVFQVPTWARLCGSICVTSGIVLGLDLPWMFDAVAGSIIYFEIGVLLGTVVTIKPPLNVPGLAFSGAVLLVTFYLAGAGYHTRLRPLGAFSGIMLCLASASLIARSKGLLPVLLEVCGRYSLQIYVLHVIFAAGLRVFLVRIGIDTFWIHLVLGSTVGVILPLTLAYLDERFLKILFQTPDFKRIAGARKPTTAPPRVGK